SPRLGPRLGGGHQSLSNTLFPGALINHKRLQYNLKSLFECWPFIRMYQSTDSASLLRHGREVRWVCKHAVYARSEFCGARVVADRSEQVARDQLNGRLK